MPHLKSLPANASLLDLFKKFPETNKPLIAFHEALLRGPSPFTEAERELIAAYVSGLNGCHYCHGVHTATAELLGIAPGLVKGLFDDLEFAGVAEKMRPVLRYARKLTQAPNSTTRADVEAMYAAGWDDVAVYHAAATTALFNFMNRLVEGLGIEFNPDYTKTAAERLARRGYTPLIQMMGD